MEKFLSCDWGTTAFRLRLIEAESLSIVAEQSTKQGISDTHEQWKKSNTNEEGRLTFYLTIIREHITAIEQKIGASLNDVPLIISGMASSTVGMVDVPYKEIPFSIDGSDLKVHTIEATDDFKHTIQVISGVRTADDVMRGEETKLIGCMADVASEKSNVYIFPGTHPKHVEVKGGKAIAFKTFITGELFDLLSKESILAVSVEEGRDLQQAGNLQSFEKGVNESKDSNLLHSLFLVRTNQVFKKLSKQENYYYLSGLLIGAQLRDLTNIAFAGLTVVGNATLTPYYIAALRIVGLPEAEIISADEALIKGQYKVYKHLVNQ
ncbi:MAG: 2-dehydro-3-deoxygalactonokinase [Segetibacter sp.]